MATPHDDPRVPLAIERTFLAWVRTGLAMMGFGFVVAKFGLFLHEISALSNLPAAPMQRGQFSAMVGTLLIGLGVFVTGWAAVRFRRDLRSLEGGEPSADRSTSIPLAVSAALCLIGIAAVVYLLYLD